MSYLGNSGCIAARVSDGSRCRVEVIRFGIQHRTPITVAILPSLEQICQGQSEWEQRCEQLTGLKQKIRDFPLNGGHRQLENCTAVLKLIKRMVADSDRIYCPPTDSPEGAMISQSMPSSGNRDNCPGDTLDCPRLW